MAGAAGTPSAALQREGSTVGAGEERQRLGLVLESVRHDDGERIRIKSVMSCRSFSPAAPFWEACFDGFCPACRPKQTLLPDTSLTAEKLQVMAKSAASASVKACDLLVRIDGRSCSELSLSEATNLITMAVLPPGTPTPKVLPCNAVLTCARLNPTML